VNEAGDLRDLKSPPGNRLDGLKGVLKGFHSIRINDQLRVVFRWSGGSAFGVQIVDYH
jgi:proteic killer suppression protein